MRHKKRRYRIHPLEHLEDLPVTLYGRFWPLCAGFRWGAFLLLNDSESLEAVEEYGIVLEAERLQVDRLVISGLSHQKMRAKLRHLENHRKMLLRNHLPIKQGWPMVLPIQLRPHPEGFCPLCETS